MHFLNAIAACILSSTAAFGISCSSESTELVTDNYIYESPEELNQNEEEQNSTYALPNYNIVANETTDFSDAYALAGHNAYYAEEFSASDTYDFVKYTATYTRCVFLHIETSNDCAAYVTVFNSREGLSFIYGSYSVNTNEDCFTMIPVRQGDTVYFKVSCAQSCTWNGTLRLNHNDDGICYADIDNLHGYSLPHTGPATITYRFDNSVNEYVDGQNFTFKEIILEAMDIWEACGNITFEENFWTQNYKIEIADISAPSVNLDVGLLGNYYFTHTKIPSSLDLYTDLINGRYNIDGTPTTIRQAVLGVCVQAMGLYLGLGIVNDTIYYYNAMYVIPFPYNYLGEGDCASFMYLWGDANAN